MFVEIRQKPCHISKDPVEFGKYSVAWPLVLKNVVIEQQGHFAKMVDDTGAEMAKELRKRALASSR